MADGNDAANLVRSEKFRRAVECALSKKSKAVRKDASPAPGALALAVQAVEQRDRMVNQFLWDVALESNITLSWDQGEVDTAVDAVMAPMLKVYETGS